MRISDWSSDVCSSDLLKNPPILILDEATSALDTRTEAEIQSTLADDSRSRTTIVIAHRLSTVVDADEIVVLDAGRVAERGTHQQLMARAGIYADMSARQDRKSGLKGKRGAVRVDTGGRRIMKKNKRDT